MATVAVHSPKSPVTKGSNGIAAATVPNVCKMPGPPAPFVPTPLPNIGRSGMSPKGYSKKVKFEGQPVAIRGSSFKSMGDIASKGTGGGIVSANVEGPTKFIAPGSLTVKVEGKNVQLLGDVMSNNNGPSGSPPNAATMAGTLQAPGAVLAPSGPTSARDIKCAILECDSKKADGTAYSPDQSCKDLGREKHKCVDEKLKGKEPEIFASPPCAMTDPPLMAMSGSKPGSSTNFFHALQLTRVKLKALGKPFQTVAQAGQKASFRVPDTMYRDARGQLKIIDAKFPCNGNKPRWGDGQFEAYEKIAGRGNVRSVTPAQVNPRQCE